MDQADPDWHPDRSNASRRGWRLRGRLRIRQAASIGPRTTRAMLGAPSVGGTRQRRAALTIRAVDHIPCRPVMPACNTDLNSRRKDMPACKPDMTTCRQAMPSRRADLNACRQAMPACSADTNSRRQDMPIRALVLPLRSSPSPIRWGEGGRRPDEVSASGSLGRGEVHQLSAIHCTTRPWRTDSDSWTRLGPTWLGQSHP